MMSTMIKVRDRIVVRDKDFRPVAVGNTLRTITAHRSAVERVDVWLKSRQLGVTWEDGASTITTVGDAEFCAKWAREWAGADKVKVQ